MSKTLVLGIDPGYTTGMAMYDGRMIKWAGDVTHTAKAFQNVAANIMHCKKLCGGDKFIVVIEDFIGSGPRTAPAIFTLKLIGWVVGFCEWMGISYRVAQPQIRKGYVDDATKLLSQHDGKTRHTGDALAHAMAYHKIAEFE